MPELPDITIYLEALERRILNQPINQIRVHSPFLLRTATPSIENLEGCRVTCLRRLGKRIVFGFENNLWLVLHLMIAGRLHWKPPGAKAVGKVALATFEFPTGALVVTEAGTRQRASLHLVGSQAKLEAFDFGGLEVLDSLVVVFAEALTRENHTLKRALTDPRLFSGIGNAYSDEILHHARLSPVTLTTKLVTEEIQRLYEATKQVLTHWTETLRRETGEKFPEHVTAFRPEMAVHGKFGKSCPVCGEKVQRIRYAENETNYCPTCQTGGKLLADRSLSMLLKRDWPKTAEELEAVKESHRVRFLQADHGTGIP